MRAWMLIGLAACSVDAPTGERCTVGTAVGDCAEDFTLTSADGSDVSLSDYLGERVVLVSNAMWCPKCRNLIVDLRDTPLQDAVLLNVLVEDNTYGTIEVSEAAAWRDAYELTFPVLADVDGTWLQAWGNGRDQHSYVIVDEDGTVAWRADSWTTEAGDDIRTALLALD